MDLKMLSYRRGNDGRWEVYSDEGAHLGWILRRGRGWQPVAVTRGGPTLTGPPQRTRKAATESLLTAHAEELAPADDLS